MKDPLFNTQKRGSAEQKNTDTNLSQVNSAIYKVCTNLKGILRTRKQRTPPANDGIKEGLIAGHTRRMKEKVRQPDKKAGVRGHVRGSIFLS